MPYNDEENKLIERMIDEEQVGPIGPGDVNAIPPPPPNWRDSVPTLTNIPTYKGKPNVLFADEETGDLIRYGMQGEEVERTVGQIPIKAKPPGRRPDNSQLTALEFVKSIDEDLKKDADEYANERVNEYMKNFSAADRILLSPDKKMALDAKIAEIRNDAYNTRYGQGQTLARIEAERRARAEEAARTKVPTETEITIGALKERLGREPTKKEIADELQERKREVARESRSLPQQTQFTDQETGKPLIFDKSTGTYKIASVEGGGEVAPRPVNPSATERERTSAFSVLKDQLARIKRDFKPGYVGLVSGRVGALTQLKDEDEAAFRQVILDVKDSLLRARSGAQINEQEYSRLARLVPSFDDSEAQFKGKMKSFEKSIDTIIEQRKEAQRKGGVKLQEGGAEKPRFTILRVK